MTKRKRDIIAEQPLPATKRAKSCVKQACGSKTQKPIILTEVLPQHYSNVKTLKDYLSEALPSVSRLRRKRLAQFEADALNNGHLLKTTLVGLDASLSSHAQLARRNDLVKYTSTQRATRAGSGTAQSCTLDEVKSTYPEGSETSNLLR